MDKKPELQNIPVEYLKRGKYQPRRQFVQEQLDELAQSIIENGVIQPIIVRPILETKFFEIIAGERRWRASQLARLDKVPCLIRAYTDKQAAAVTTIENIQREDLNPIEEALAYKRLAEDFGYTHEEISAIVGKCRSKITNAIRLLSLDTRIQGYLIEGKLSEGHGKILAGLKNNHQVEMASACISKAWSVRKLEQMIKKLNEPNSNTDFNKLPKHLQFLEKKLADHIGSKVEIGFDTDAKNGKLTINFHNLDALQGIFQKLKFEIDDS